MTTTKIFIYLCQLRLWIFFYWYSRLSLKLQSLSGLVSGLLSGLSSLTLYDFLFFEYFHGRNWCIFAIRSAIINEKATQCTDLLWHFTTEWETPQESVYIKIFSDRLSSYINASELVLFRYVTNQIANINNISLI